MKDKSSRGGRCGGRENRATNRHTDRAWLSSPSPRGREGQRDKPRTHTSPLLQAAPEQLPHNTHTPTATHTHPAVCSQPAVGSPQHGTPVAPHSSQPLPCADCCPSDGRGSPSAYGITAPLPSKATLQELLPRAQLCPQCPVPLPRAPRRARGGDAWLLSRRCFQRPPLHSNTAMAWGGRSSTPQPCSPPWSRGLRPRFAPKCGENQQQQLSATALRLLHPGPNAWGQPRQPQYLSAHSVLAADNRGDKTEGHTDGQTSEVYSFWSTRAPVLQDGAEP